MNKDVVEQQVVAPFRGVTLFTMYYKMIQQVLSFLSGLTGTGSTPAMPTAQFLGVQPITIVVPRIGEALGIEILPLSMLGAVKLGLIVTC